MKTKTILAFLLFMTCSSAVFSQGSEFISSRSYLSAGTGLNYNTGILGIQYEYKFATHFSGYTGAGLGSWGYKFAVGSRFYLQSNEDLGSAFTISYAYTTGANDVKTQLEVIENGNEVTRTVTFDAKPVSLLNLSWVKFWRLGQKSRVNFELGYSFPLNNNFESNYKINDPVVLTDRSKSVLRTVQPGGIIIGVGFSFGL